jgi:hypothetical protein
MKIVEIKNIQRKDVPIYYRMLYTGTAVIELVSETIERGIDFSVETKPTGQKEITVTFAEPVDYPTVPLNREIKKFIQDLDSSGGLPV